MSAFQKRRIGGEKKSPSVKKRTYKKRAYNSKKGTKKNQKSFIKKYLSYGILGLLFFGTIGSFILYQKIIAPLPSISELENLEIAQASIIYDREGNELYKIFKEKRIYVDFNQINRNIIDALVAGEDKRYWENPGVDFIGLVRAGIYGVIGKNEGFGGTSTLTQQLIRNTIIENRSSQESIFDKLERKIKEIYLAFKLTGGVSKEKIIELYLNKISYGSNAFGIEQASKTFFNKSAKDINVLEASMLASLPKGPSYYSPYNHHGRLVGYPYIYSKDDKDSITNIISPTSVSENGKSVKMLKDYISEWELKRYSESKALICGLDAEKLKSNISIDKDGCSVIGYEKFLTLLNAIKIANGDDFIEYQTGRKDFILGRMLEDDYITFDEYRSALIESIGFTFNEYTEKIKAPHFVFYVREYLEEKYGKEILEKGGLKIYTSLDPDLQEKAEEFVEKGAKSNEAKFAAHNAALISLDNKTGEILAMVGGRNYFDKENKGNVNMVTSALQPGSSFKPFVYSLAIDQEVVGSKTPIYDVKTTFPGNYTPQNFDGKFKGKMNVSTALNNSRNIPAIKMYYLAGGENKILNWMEKLGVNSIRKFKENYSASSGKEYSYGASMALGSVMMTPLELAQAYSVYANLGIKRDTIPVIKILDSEGLVIEEFIPEENKGKKVIDSATAYITNYILSDTGSRPSFWNTYLALAGRKVAAKTGTSTKGSSGKGKIVYPRNLWTVGYTPQVTTVVWAGNNDGSETNLKGNGLEGAGPIWKNYMDYYHKNKGVEQWNIPKGVKQVNISDLSGKLAPDGFNQSFISNSLFVNSPQSYDTNLSSARVDLLCNGPISETTPISAIGDVYIFRMNSLKPELNYWENPVQLWIAASDIKESLNLGENYVSSIKTEACERTGLTGKIEIAAKIEKDAIFSVGNNYVDIGYLSDSALKKIDIFLDDIKIYSIPLSGRKKGVYSGNIIIPKGHKGGKNLILKAIDSQYYAESKSYPIKIIPSDVIPPEINITNPIDHSISLYSGDFFNLRGNIIDSSEIRSLNFYINDKPHKIGLKTREFVEEFSSDLFQTGKNTIKIEAVDFDLNKGYTSVDVKILER